MEREIVYLPHPVTPEEKAKHLKAGKRIMDIRFAPKGYAAPLEKAPVISNEAEPAAEPVATPAPENSVREEPAPKRRRGRPRKKAD